MLSRVLSILARSSPLRAGARDSKAARECHLPSGFLPAAVYWSAAITAAPRAREHEVGVRRSSIRNIYSSLAGSTELAVHAPSDHGVSEMLS